eukprot:5740625-Amphidinium_carterae.1
MRGLLVLAASILLPAENGVLWWAHESDTVTLNLKALVALALDSDGSESCETPDPLEPQNN